MELLKKLCSIHAPSGNEGMMQEFLLDFIRQEMQGWKTQPVIFSGDEFGNCIVLVFGTPVTAVYAHIDNIGFTVRYNNHIVKIGSPKCENGYLLRGYDSKGPVEGRLLMDPDGHMLLKNAGREVDRGTDLSFKADWREDANYVQCCYMDNRLGVWNALQLCRELSNGAIVFSCQEEHGGGTVPFLARFLWEKYSIRQALISDITWVTEGVHAGKGVAISLRDSGIPRKKYVEKIVSLCRNSGIPFQLEVESSGGSDGTELQKQPYAINWCFIGAPEEMVHSPDERVHKADIAAMADMYRFLMKEL